MKKLLNRNLFFLLFILTVPLQIIAMISSGAGSPPRPPGAPIHSPPPSAQKIKPTPDRIEEQNAQTGATPLTAAERLVEGAEQTGRENSHRRCLRLAFNSLNVVQSPLCPDRRKRRAGIATRGQLAVARHLYGAPIDLGSADVHRTLERDLPGDALSSIFAGFARRGGLVRAIGLRHVIDGDHNGGKHFLFTPEAYTEFVGNSMQLGFVPAVNPVTGVEYGADIIGVRRHNKTIVQADVKGLNEDAAIRLINELLENPTSLHAESPAWQRVFGICSIGFPLELYLKPGHVLSAYPIYSYLLWQPGQAALVVAPIIQAGQDFSVVMTSDQILVAARALLSVHIPTDHNNPIRYVNYTRNTLIVDFAQYLANPAGIETGIYVELPLAQFSIAMLRANFPDLFAP